MKWTEYARTINGEMKKVEPEPKEPKKKPTELMYPDREGFDRVLYRGGGMEHIGYATMRMRQCVCGARPVLEQWHNDADEDGKRNVPAKKFVAICPRCEMLIIGHGGLEACIKQWNARRYTKLSLLKNSPLTEVNREGAIALVGKVFGGMIEDAIALCKRKRKIMEELRVTDNDLFREQEYMRLKAVRSEIADIWTVFEGATSALSYIRQRLYPNLTPDDRLKIPLDLRKM